jgi:hypothetical protein
VNLVRILDSGEVWFKATRLSDSATVYGIADIDAGTITITNVTKADELFVFFMEAILRSDFLSIDGNPTDWAIDLRSTTDATNDGSTGHELAFLSHQQSATQFFVLMEFHQNNIATTDALQVITVDSLYDLIVGSDSATFKKLADSSETRFITVGGLSAIGKAVELSIPLSALAPLACRDSKQLEA